MSTLLAVVQAVVASPSPLPAASPEAVKTIVQTVAVTPEWVRQAIELASFVIPGYIASFVHSLVKNRSLKLQSDAYTWVNAALLFSYSALTAAVVLFMEGKLSLQSPDTMAAAFLTVLGAASLRYNVLKLKQNNVADTDTKTAPVASPEATPATGF